MPPLPSSSKSTSQPPASEITREVYYSPKQMFDLVADVARYPDFVPNWHMVRVRPVSETTYRTDQVIRFGPMRHTFTSTTELTPPHQIIVTSSDSPFKTLRLQWQFDLAEDGGCRITLTVSFELKIKVLQGLTSLFSRDSIIKMVDAFEHRALDIYGPPRQASHD